ncbi:hypothetical protein TNCV_4215581 [Trichonephila clavipes]|nr:hypothetical protein TNCV_4215581 [Trichonephila clavipes]
MMAENTTGRNNWGLEEYDRTRPSVCSGMTHIFHGPQMKIDVEKNGLVSVVSRKEIEKNEVFFYLLLFVERLSEVISSEGDCGR